MNIWGLGGDPRLTRDLLIDEYKSFIFLSLFVLIASPGSL
jgi:hypothetical protein